MASLLSVRGLRVTVASRGAPLEVVRGIDLEVEAGSLHAIVGESGCGKSMAVSGLLDLAPGEAEVRFEAYVFDGRSLTLAEVAGLRGRGLSMVFQDPSLALDPLQRIGDALLETLAVHGAPTEAEAARLLADAGLPGAADKLRAYPHQLSGGQRQRVCLALALACRPRVLVLDEATTALDPALRLALMETLRQQKEKQGLAMLFVTHDLALASQAADTLTVMYGGTVVESGPALEVLARPRHPYTAALVESVPRLDGGRDVLPTIPGVVPAAADWPSGCPFAPRCARAVDRCAAERPSLTRLDSVGVACHLPLERSA